MNNEALLKITNQVIREKRILAKKIREDRISNAINNLPGRLRSVASIGEFKCIIHWFDAGKKWFKNFPKADNDEHAENIEEMYLYIDALSKMGIKYKLTHEFQLNYVDDGMPAHYYHWCLHATWGK